MSTTLHIPDNKSTLGGAIHVAAPTNTLHTQGTMLTTGHEDNLAERAIRDLQKKAEDLINAQNAPMPVKPTGKDEQKGRLGQKGAALKKKQNSQPMVGGIGGTSIFTLNPDAKREPEEPPHKTYLRVEGKKEEKDITDDVWFDLYGSQVNKFETQFDRNEKLQKEILRRIDRYNQNEKHYREEIKLLQRELRVRYGYEKHAETTNQAIQNKYNQEIDFAIENHMNQVKILEEEQQKEISRKYRSELAKTNKIIEERKNKSGDEGSDLKEREAELRNSLELITNIAQRINDENRALRKKNEELRSQHKAQENDRELLVKQLVLQKKDNSKIRTEIDVFTKQISEHEANQEHEEVDLDKEVDENVDTNNIMGGGRQATAKTRASVNLGRKSTAGLFRGGEQVIGKHDLQGSGPLIYEPARKAETEDDKVVRYERVIEKLRKMMDHEKKLLKTTKASYEKEISFKTELEILLKQASDKVIGERKAYKKQNQTKLYANMAGHQALGIQKEIRENKDFLPEDDQEMNQHDRERVIELLLSQERVISLLYDRAYNIPGGPSMQDQGRNGQTTFGGGALPRQEQYPGMMPEGEGEVNV